MREPTCTSEGWSVSSMFGSGIDGHVLSVRRYPFGVNGPSVKGDHDGRRFDTSDEVSRFCLERGYTRRFFRSPDSRRRRVERGRQPWHQPRSERS